MVGGRRVEAGWAEDRADLDRLAPEWSALAARAGNPFATPEWTLAGLRSDAAAEPFVGWVRSAGQLLGVLPLLRRESKLLAPPLADRAGPLVEASERADVARELGAALPPRGWSSIDLGWVDAGSAGWVSELLDGSGRPLASRDLGAEVSPWIDAAGYGHDWDTYIADRPRSVRKNLARARRKLEREHAVSFRRSSPQTLEHDLAELKRQHVARMGGVSSLTGEWRLVEAAARDFAARDLLELWMLEVDGRSCASELWFRCGEVLWAYQGGMDVSDRAVEKLSPAGVLQDHLIRRGFELGVERVEYGLGGEDYKRRICPRTTELVRIQLTRRDRPRHYLEVVRSAARHGYRSLRDVRRSDER